MGLENHLAWFGRVVIMVLSSWNDYVYCCKLHFLKLSSINLGGGFNFRAEVPKMVYCNAPSREALKCTFKGQSVNLGGDTITMVVLPMRTKGGL